MAFIEYLKAGPNQFVFQYRNGRLVRSGPGLSFLYYQPATSIVIVPVSSADVPFIFNEISADFQPLTVQGQLTYRITDPVQVSGMLDYRVAGPKGAYLSEDPQKLDQRLVNLAQVLVRAEIQGLPLRQAIHASEEVARAVLVRLASEAEIKALGLEVLAIAIQAIRPTPEMARSLEADAREALYQEADLAIYNRRNAAVDQERRIKENELQTEIAVEEKKRLIRERKVEADLAVEEKEQQVRLAKLTGQIRLEDDRRQLVAARAENIRAEADAQSYALDASLKPLRQMDADLLQMLSIQTVEPRKMVSLAMKELAQNAAKIGTLHISPDLFESLMKEVDGQP